MTTYRYTTQDGYGVATMSRLLKTVGLFCKRALEKSRYSTKEIYIFKEPTNRSHHISDKRIYIYVHVYTQRIHEEHICTSRIYRQYVY